MTTVESIKSRLKNLAIKENSSMQNELTLYTLERTIYRISISEYNDKFTLKGGIFLYALFDRDYPRATQDIDLLGNKISNDMDIIKRIFTEIFSIKCNDHLRFDLNSLNVKSITEFKEYHGLNVSILAYLDRTRINVSIDIGYGDIVSPNRVKMEFPVLLDMESPKIYAYSIYSAIAEKFEAFVSLGSFNSRYKDFYDIYAIASKTNFNGSELQNAIIETFKHRNTTFEDIIAFTDEYKNNPLNNTRWNNFLKKKQVSLHASFIDTIHLCERLLSPIVDSILKNETFNKTWDYETQKWNY